MYPTLKKVKYIRRQPDISVVCEIKENKILRHPINGTAVSILELCTGQNEINEIIENLSIKYSENKKKVKTLVYDFIEFSQRLGIIETSNKPLLEEIIIDMKGNDQWWTPNVIIMEITHACSLSCKHCYLDAGDLKYMNFNEFISICEEIDTLGVDTVQLTGGEPLIHPDFSKMVNHLCNLDVYIMITTNGYISSNKLNELNPVFQRISEGKGHIQVSIDGLEINHNQMRGHTNAFERSVKFIEQMVMNKLEVHVATVVTKESIDDLYKLSKFLKNKGVKIHRIGFLNESGRAEKQTVTPEFIRVLLDKIEHLKRDFNDNNFSIQKLEELQSEHDSFKFMNCGAGSRTVKLSPDGVLSPCPLLDLPMGKIEDNSLATIFKKNSKLYSQIKSPGSDICGNCDYIIKCDGCFAEGLLNKNKVDTCIWYEKYSENFKSLEN